MRQTSSVARAILGPTALLLMANAVPTTAEELTKRAALVVDVTVAKLDADKKPSKRTKCFDAVVTSWAKGTSEKLIRVCPNDISEWTPPTPKLGRRYRMYLLGSPSGIYRTFSYAGFERIPTR